MITVEDVTVQFGGVRPLDALSVVFDEPIAGLVGPNGAGKTTFLNVLSGFVTPRTGRIDLDGVSLAGLKPAARVRAGLRRLFQQELIVEDLSLYDNVCGVADNLSREDKDGEVRRALEFVGLYDVRDVIGAEANLFQRRITEIAKTLIGAPKCILLDEPGAGLDEAETLRLRSILLGIPQNFATQLVLIDHDVDLISAVCSQTLVLDFGKKLAHGPTQAVLNDPVVRNAYLGA